MASPPLNKLRVLALGDVDHRELRGPFELVQRCGLVSLTVAEPSPHESFELVLVFQSRPGSIEPSTVEALRGRYPLAGLVVVLGTWCEGEARTGRPLVGFERLFWYQFPAWWRQAEADWQAGRPTSWQQPMSPSSCQPIEYDGLIAIDTTDADAAEALLAACDALDATAVWTPRWRSRPLGSNVAAGIWGGGQLDATEAVDLATFRRWLPENVPLVVLLDFPRFDRIEQARQLGATAVLGKPWRLEQLAASLAEPIVVPQVG